MRTMASPAKHLLSGAVAKPRSAKQRTTGTYEAAEWRACTEATVDDDAPGTFGPNRKDMDRT